MSHSSNSSNHKNNITNLNNRLDWACCSIWVASGYCYEREGVINPLLRMSGFLCGWHRLMTCVLCCSNPPSMNTPLSIEMFDILTAAWL
eukprot:m.17277 g.17277  ORF g.17277 m.17277 type:complete len:89 (-) comp10663_c0_seq4:701-967(-)